MTVASVCASIHVWERLKIEAWGQANMNAWKYKRPQTLPSL